MVQRHTFPSRRVKASMHVQATPAPPLFGTLRQQATAPFWPNFTFLTTLNSNTHRVAALPWERGVGSAWQQVVLAPGPSAGPCPPQPAAHSRPPHTSPMTRPTNSPPPDEGRRPWQMQGAPHQPCATCATCNIPPPPPAPPVSSQNNNSARGNACRAPTTASGHSACRAPQQQGPQGCHRRALCCQGPAARMGWRSSPPPQAQSSGRGKIEGELMVKTTCAEQCCPQVSSS